MLREEKVQEEKVKLSTYNPGQVSQSSEALRIGRIREGAGVGGGGKNTGNRYPLRDPKKRVQELDEIHMET